ncbi:MAG TPA: nucleotidyltransferase domain-containing protein [Terriglobales bacterium]|nr:nucleotidyltransferase domain-containing protein [Terriglobales bacterium]
MADLTTEELAVVRDILRRHLGQARVWVFGSRARGDARPTSDLDLAIISERPLPFAKLGELEEDFAESDLPFRVDIVDWASTSTAFRSRIEACYEDILT